MRTVRTVAELRELLAPERRAGRSIGLVPLASMLFLVTGTAHGTDELQRVVGLVPGDLWAGVFRAGTGEASQGPAAAAIANAVAGATGKRIRELPFTRARVKAAIGV